MAQEFLGKRIHLYNTPRAYVTSSRLAISLVA